MLALENIDNIIQKLFLLYVFFWDGQMDSFLRKILRRGHLHDILQTCGKWNVIFVNWMHKNDVMKNILHF